MRTTQLLIAVAVMTHCEIVDSARKARDFFHGREDGQIENDFGVSTSGHNFLALKETLIKENGSSAEHPNVEMTAKSNHNDPNLNKLIHAINSAGGTGRALMQNDTVLTNVEAGQIVMNNVRKTRAKRQVVKDYGNKNRTWQNGVFYTFNTSDNAVKKCFKMGVQVWKESTCVDFTEDKNAQDKIIVVKEDECWSDIGKLGGDQFLSLDDGCEEMFSVHEIGHALGLYHTMARFDRDNYIQVVKRNIDSSFFGEFTKVPPTYAEVYGLTYDYGSIMHYDEQIFSANSMATMIARNPFYQKTMGSPIVSFSDIFVINERYGCNARCNKSTSAKCLNEGFPHPRNCSICICPGGYGGALCDRRPPGCGEDLEATSKERPLAYRLGFGTGLIDQFNFCNYVIRAPQKKRIEVYLKSVSPGYDYPGCVYGGVEIKAQKDQKLTGYRFCSADGSGDPIISSSNRLSVILFNRRGVMQAIFTYRYID